MAEKGYYGFFKGSRQVIDAWHKTEETARILGARIIVFQCPPTFLPTEENRQNLRLFFSSIDRDRYLFVWEPRGPWQEEEIKAVCRELNLIHGVDPFKKLPLHGDPRYFRLHGKTGYHYHYSKEDLRHLQQMCPEAADVYCMFNNSSMYEDACTFRRLFPELVQ
jgi:uncharacterized protein YecE (DUF72 family)